MDRADEGVRQPAAAGRAQRARRRAAVSPSVAARLRDAARKPIALIVAPAGYGKTTLLRHLTASHGEALFVDAGAGEGTFRDAVRELCEALRGISLGARIAFASSYARAMQSGRPAPLLARWLARYLEGHDATLVVDGVDRLGAEVPLFAELIERLVAELPGRLQVVLAARNDAGLPIPRWFASELCGMPLGADDLEPPAGPLPDARALFETLSELERGILRKTCLLRAFDEPLLAALGVPVRALVDASPLRALIVPDGAGGYRYEERLRALACEALRADPPAHREVAEATVDALEAAGRVRAALDAARAAHLTEHVRRLLRAHGTRLEDHGDLDAVEAALDVLPAHDDDPAVMLFRASREARNGRTDMAEAWFRHVIDRAASPPALAVEAAYRLARELVRHDRADAVELLEGFVTGQALAPKERAGLLSLLAQAYVVAQRPDDAHRASVEALELSGPLDAATRAHVHARAAYVEFSRGDAAMAREHAAVGARLAEEARLDVVAVGAYSVLYNIVYDAEGPTAAMRSLERLADCAIRCGNVDFHVYALVAAYDIDVELGDVAAIERVEHGLRAFDLHYGASPSLEGLVPGRAFLAAWAGQFGTAHDLLAPSAAQQVHYPDREALRWSEIALFAAAAGRRDAAVAALERFTDAFGRDGGHSALALRGCAVASVAAELAGAAPIALPEMPNARLDALAKSAATLVAWYRGGAALADVLAALQALHGAELGGLAKVFAALPARAA